MLEVKRMKYVCVEMFVMWWEFVTVHFSHAKLAVAVTAAKMAFSSRKITSKIRHNG